MSRPGLLAPLLTAAAAVAVTTIVRGTLDARTGPGWRRLNYRGSTVTLSNGPAVACGLLAGLAISGRRDLGAALAVGGAAAAGLYDDWASARADERAAKGFHGHLAALAAGRASAGVVKVGVIGASSLAGAFLRTGPTLDTLLAGGLVAGSANLCNLLDLRPGRALKVAALVDLAVMSRSDPALVGVVLGTVAAAVPADLAERSMLGDTGSNALGAMLGSLLCRHSRRTRVLALTAVAGLTALSERVSFTQVIAGNPVLRRLDELGRFHD